MSHAAPGEASLRARNGLMAAVCAMRGLEELDLRQNPAKQWSAGSLGELSRLIEVVRRPQRISGLSCLKILLVDEVEGAPQVALCG